MKKILVRAFRASIPVLMGYLVLGFGFGILLQEKGYGVMWAFIMSLTIYGGSMQYAAVDLLSGGASLITTAVMTVVINARHFFYGISMLDKYKKAGRLKPYLIFSLTDETYSLLCSSVLPEEMNKERYYFFVSFFNHMYWICGGVLGAWFGSMVEFNSAGIEFSMTALFIVIFVEQWIHQKQHLPAMIGVSVSVVCLVIFGANNFIIPSMIAISVLLTLFRRQLGGDQDE